MLFSGGTILQEEPQDADPAAALRRQRNSHRHRPRRVGDAAECSQAPCHQDPRRDRSFPRSNGGPCEEEAHPLQFRRPTHQRRRLSIHPRMIFFSRLLIDFL